MTEGATRMITGSVRWYDAERGFGFVTPEGGGEDIYCHYTAILADGCFKSLGEGQKLEFEVFPGPDGPAAVNVRRVFDEKSVLVTVLCSDAVQVRAIAWGRPNLAKVAERLRAFGEVKLSGYLVRLRAAPHELTLFDDGRAIVKGTGDVAVARALLGSWLGVRIPAAE